MRPRPVPPLYSLLIAIMFMLAALPSMAIHAQSTPPEPLQLEFSPASNADERPASEIFAEVSPAVAFIETPMATGSGALIGHGYILTNAHVVWPYETTRVVFADGTEHLDVPIAAWDLMADLALVGPIDTDIAPIRLADGGELAIGSEVYLIGYPAEVEKFPQPTITSGILSRIRTWDALDYSFYQVDATTTGGQSGGIMIAQNGDVIGISTFYYSGFGLAGSVADALPRLNAMLGNDTGVSLVDRSFHQGTSALEHEGAFAHDFEEHIYVLEAPVGEKIEISVDGVGEPQLVIASIFMDPIAHTEAFDAETHTQLSFTIEEEMPYYVATYQISPEPANYTLTSSHPLTAYVDPDDEQSVKVGQSYAGMMDTPFDVDTFGIFLKTGDTITVKADSLSIDPTIILIHLTKIREDIYADEDSGGGIFGRSAEIVYQAPKTGHYEIIVAQPDPGGIGGYFLDVTPAAEDVELTTIESSRAFVQTEFGTMAKYESDENDFSMLYPATWSSIFIEECESPATFCAAGDMGVLILVEERLSQLPKRMRSREGYVEQMQNTVEVDPAIEFKTVESVTTIQELRADRLAYDIPLEDVQGHQFVYVDEEANKSFIATFLVTAEEEEFITPAIDYMFDSFRDWGAEEQSGEQSHGAAYYLDQGKMLASAEDYDGAIAAYTESIALAPDLLDAYWERGLIYLSRGMADAARVDFDRVSELDPDNADRLSALSLMHWVDRKHETALEYINQAIRLQPGRINHYNTRALINASLHNYEHALADVSMTLKFNKGELALPVQDTRAYIFIQLGDYESARQDYDELLDQNFRTPYSLLGAGIAHAEMGETETGYALLAEGFEMLEEEKYNTAGADPQLFALISMANRILPKDY